MPDLLSKKEVSVGGPSQVMKNSYQAIESVLTAAHRKRRALRLLRLLLWTLILAAALTLAAVVVIPILEGAPRMAARIAWLGGFGIVVGGGVVAAWIRRESLAATALAIESVNPWLQNALINSLQLARAASQGGSAAAFSPVFLEKHLEATAGALPRLDLDKAAPRSALKRPAIVLAIIGAAWLATAGFFPERAGQGWSALFLEPWDGYTNSDGTAKLPLTTGDFTIHYSFPAYTQIQAQTVEHTNGDIAALKGTGVRIETRVLEPLQTASLVTSTGSRYAMTVRDQTLLQAELSLSDPGTYFIEGEGSDGRRRAEPKSHRIVVDVDLAPLVAMLTPVQDVEIAAEGSLPLSYEASDDFGIREVAIIYQLDGQDHEVRVQSITADGKRKVLGEYEWIIADMDFQSGQRIPFYLQVTDNDEIAGGKTGRSEMRVLEIYSARNEHRKFLARQDELFNMLIDHLAAHLDAAIKDRAPNSDPAASEKTLLEQGRGLVTFMADLYLALMDDEFADRLVTEALNDMEVRYTALLDDREKLIGAPRPLAANTRDLLFSLRDEYRTGLEKDILFFDKLIKKQRVEDLLSEADDLYQAQADLADLLAEYKKTGDPALLERLRQAMAELQEAFANLMRRMAETRKDLPEEFINADAMKKMDAMNLAAEMEKLRQALADGDMENALSMAEQFLAQMGQWMAAMEQSANEFGSMMSAEMMAKLNQTQDQLADLIKRQQQVEDGLQEMYQKVMQRMDAAAPDEQGAANLVEKIKELSRALHEAQRLVYQMNPAREDGKPMPAALSGGQRNAAVLYNRIGNDAWNLGEQVQEGSLKEALDQARRIRDDVGRANQQAADYVEKSHAGPPEIKEEFEAKSNQAEKLAEEILRDLENLDQAFSFQLDGPERSELEELSKMQEAIRQDTESVREGYETLRQEVPSLPGEVSDHLGNGALKMHDSSGEMLLGEPGRAQVPAREARVELEKAQGMLQKAQQQIGQSMMMGGGMMFGKGSMAGGSMGSRNSGREGRTGVSTGKVEIPDEGAYQVPEQFREEILRAMKEDSPDAYRNLNRDYYERLVR